MVVDDIFAPSKAAGKVPPSVLVSASATIYTLYYYPPPIIQSQPDSTQHTVKDDLFIEATDASGKVCVALL